MQNIENGSLLISHPTMLDDTFFKGIILITHHNYEESIGLVINRPSKIKLHEIISEIPVSNFPVYIGGPVAKNSIHYIHNIGKKIPESIKIVDGLYFGGDFDVVKNLIEAKEISKKNIRFFAGYTGWESNQLEKEIKEESWIINKANKELCLRYSNENLWGEILRKMDKKYAIWSNLPKNPSLN